MSDTETEPPVAVPEVAVPKTKKARKKAAKKLAQHADGKMTVSEGKSMRMKLMSRMRKGMTLEEARKDIA